MKILLLYAYAECGGAHVPQYVHGGQNFVESVLSFHLYGNSRVQIHQVCMSSDFTHRVVLLALGPRFQHTDCWGTWLEDSSNVLPAPETSVLLTL